MRTTEQEYRTETTVLAVAVEMAKNSWKVGLDDGSRRRPRVKRCDADVAAERFFEVTQLIEQIRVEWALPDSVRIVVGYEAGQDGFWLARALEEAGYEAVVIDPASIPVERHRRRSKTDRLDAIRLVLALRRWLRGERDAMRAVRIPTCELEDQRWHSRDRKQLQKERNQHRDRIRKLLRTQGCWEPIGRDFAKRLERGAIRDWRGAALGASLRARLALEWQRLELVEAQLREREAESAERLDAHQRARVEQLQRLKAVGPHSATPLVVELYWRDFRNRREVGSCAGLVCQPYDSGESRIDQGISKQGKSSVRVVLIELAWMWLRHQPDSELSRWFARRTAGQGKRVRRIMIVALARKLAIALWRYLETGQIPAGAKLKTA